MAGLIHPDKCLASGRGTVRGKVIWINSYKGYGEIQNQNGESFYFVLANLNIDQKKIVIGAEFKFELGSYSIFGQPAITRLEIIEPKSERKPLKNPEVVI